MAELASIYHLFNAPSSSAHRIQEAQTTIYNVRGSLPSSPYTARAGGRTGNLAGEPVIMASFGDMTRVPGSTGRPLALGVKDDPAEVPGEEQEPHRSADPVLDPCEAPTSSQRRRPVRSGRGSSRARSPPR